MDQMMGEGPRCFEHNPTPEERELHPERYARGKFANAADLRKDMQEAT